MPRATWRKALLWQAIIRTSHFALFLGNTRRLMKETWRLMPPCLACPGLNLGFGASSVGCIPSMCMPLTLPTNNEKDCPLIDIGVKLHCAHHLPLKRSCSTTVLQRLISGLEGSILPKDPLPTDLQRSELNGELVIAYQDLSMRSTCQWIMSYPPKWTRVCLQSRKITLKTQDPSQMIQRLILSFWTVWSL